MASKATRAKEVGGDGAARWSPAIVQLGAIGAIAAAYLLIFATTRDVGPGRLAVLTARNTVSLALVAGLARLVLLRFVEPLPAGKRVVPHAAAAICFTILWYWVLTVVGGLFDGESATSFSVRPFLLGPVAEWQLFQGLLAYAVVAMLAHGEARACERAIRKAEPDAPTAATVPTRMLVRVGDEIVAMEPGEIVSIIGADDYAELTTTTARHLVRTSLAEFEGMLPSGRFLRVHRSAIVNLDRLVRAEPAGGGRLSLHMGAGPVVQASRAGARALRERLV